ncbi:putative septum site-determining protein MinC [Acetobacteraceae bacterium EV16G]|uniref:Probable septum site-determining protein MinC n=2 Tax=Sorlinia euscelidii TaxID=3081148 RepID=A0ABU7TYF1_9PROT
MSEQTVDIAQSPRPMTIRACGRSFMALVLAPQAPIADWLSALDHQVARSSAFLSGKPIILDLGLLDAAAEGLADLQAALRDRHIIPVSIEGGDRTWPALRNWDFPPVLTGGRAHDIAPPDATEAEGTAGEFTLTAGRTLFVETPVRSGQIVTWLEGDIVVAGGVAPGAELIASGSIHVYGPLRGRAIAGVGGNGAARIFARRMFAELLAIDGFYMTAEEIDQQSVGQPAQALLDSDHVLMHPLT